LASGKTVIGDASVRSNEGGAQCGHTRLPAALAVAEPGPGQPPASVILY